MWKNFFHFTEREKRGILLLIVALGGIFIGKFIFSGKQKNPEPIQVEDTFSNAENSDLNRKTYYKEQEYYHSGKSKSFNQNSRSKNFSDKEGRTYYTGKEQATGNKNESHSHFPKTEKFAPGAVIEINRSDTSELMKIPGIGSSFASRIVKYREILGGYYSIEQLQEVYGMYVELYEKISPFFNIHTDSIRKIPVNKCSLEKLKSHPYINFYQAKAIIEMRKKKGNLKTIDELRLLEEFTETDLEKIRSYLSFD